MHSPRTFGPVALAATALSLLLAGCGGSGSDDRAATTSTVASTTTVAPPPSTTTTTTLGGGTDLDGSEITADPCTLLSGAEIEAVGGTAGVAKRDDFNDAFPGCDYGTVKLYVNMDPSYLPEDGTPITGVGDGATYEKSWHRLFVETNGSILLVACAFCEGQGDELSQLSGLAESVIAKL